MRTRQSVITIVAHDVAHKTRGEVQIKTFLEFDREPMQTFLGTLHDTEDVTFLVNGLMASGDIKADLEHLRPA